ncbi:MAG: omptin family outer membrane protease [Thermodesulfobacteriota bacterium]|nr:omptin family outer membrane protease [Thermodesulfobacteriota bacterium]
MRKIFIAMLLGFFIIISTSSILAAEVDVDFSADLAILHGDTTYQIGGAITLADGSFDSIHFPLSELEFPLDAYMATLGMDMNVERRFYLSAEYRMNINKDAGKMKDSDWMDPYILDIYSESDSELTARIMRVVMGYGFYNLEDLSFVLDLGYIHQRFEYDVKDLCQQYPSGRYTGVSYAPGKVLTYETTYKIPYLALGVKGTGERTSSAISIGGTPLVSVEDEDHHLIRDPPKISKGDCTGHAYIASLNVTHAFSSRWSLDMGLDSLVIKTKGEQTQYQVPGGLLATIDQEITSEQIFFYFGIKYRFLPSP